MDGFVGWCGLQAQDSLEKSKSGSGILEPARTNHPWGLADPIRPRCSWRACPDRARRGSIDRLARPVAWSVGSGGRWGYEGDLESLAGSGR